MVKEYGFRSVLIDGHDLPQVWQIHMTLEVNDVTDLDTVDAFRGWFKFEKI